MDMIYWASLEMNLLEIPQEILYLKSPLTRRVIGFFFFYFFCCLFFVSNKQPRPAKSSLSFLESSSSPPPKAPCPQQRQAVSWTRTVTGRLPWQKSALAVMIYPNRQVTQCKRADSVSEPGMHTDYFVKQWEGRTAPYPAWLQANCSDGTVER